MGASVQPSILEQIAPARRARAVENDSSTDGIQEFPSQYCTVFVGTGGDISVFPTRGNAPVVYRNVQDGKHLNVSCKAIDWNNTTASDIVIEY